LLRNLIPGAPAGPATIEWPCRWGVSAGQLAGHDREPLRYTGQSEIAADIANFKAALGGVSASTARRRDAGRDGCPNTHAVHRKVGGRHDEKLVRIRR
jgi:hypothetical protein